MTAPPDDSPMPEFAYSLHRGSLPDTWTVEFMTQNGLYVLKDMTLVDFEMFLQALEGITWDDWESVLADWALMLSEETQP